MSIDSITFDVYKSKNGELNRSEFKAVQRYNCTEDQIDEAIDYIMDAYLGINLNIVVPDGDYEFAAKLLGVLGDKIPKEVDETGPHKMWLLTEAYLLQGKDTTTIHKAILKNMWGYCCFNSLFLQNLRPSFLYLTNFTLFFRKI